MAFKSSKSSGKKEYDNTNKGALWLSDKPDDYNPDPEIPHGPELRGQINVDGVDYWVSAFLAFKDIDMRSPVVELLSELASYLESEEITVPAFRLSVKAKEETKSAKAESFKSAPKGKATGVKPLREHKKAAAAKAKSTEAAAEVDDEGIPF